MNTSKASNGIAAEIMERADNGRLSPLWLVEAIDAARAEAVAEARAAWIAKFGEMEAAAHAASEAIDALEKSMRNSARLMGECQ